MALPVPSGEMELDLSQSSTVPGEAAALPVCGDSEVSDASSEITPTVSEITPTVPEIEVVSSEDEVVEITELVLSTTQEIEKMREEERYGHLYRVQDRQRAREDRLRRVLEDIASEDPEARRVRRRSFQAAVYGRFL